MEDYCSDCGCVADDEICPRCQSEIADDRRRNGDYRGDRRWNGQVMSHRNADTDPRVLTRPGSLIQEDGIFVE